MTSYEDPKTYWEKRLSTRFDLEGVGFGSLGPNYNAIMYEARRRTLREAVQACGFQFEGQHVLEVGCGTGFYTRLCKQEKVASYTGIDITEISVQRLACSYPHYRFLQADISADITAFDEPFDIVLIADVLFHIVDENRFHQAIANLSQLTRPGGHLILSDLLSTAPVQKAAHCRSRSLVEYQSVLAEHRLKIQHIEPIFAVLQPPVQVPGTSLLWQAYALLWLYGFMRMAHWRWFDRSVPRLLARLDQDVFLPGADVRTPNTKWLVALKDNHVD